MEKFIVIWGSLDFLPTTQDLDNCIICLDYHAHDTEQLIAWLDLVQDIVLDNDVDFDTILIWADYERMDAVEVAKLVRKFYMHGAMFTGYADKVASFNEAVENYRKRIAMMEKIRKKIENVRQQA